MYVILDRSLVAAGWSEGSMMAQACHAATKCIWEFKNDPSAQAYMNDLQNMRKIVLSAQSNSQLEELQAELIARGIEHAPWIEQPESILTCIATKPIKKSALGNILKEYKLYK